MKAFYKLLSNLESSPYVVTVCDWFRKNALRNKELGITPANSADLERFRMSLEDWRGRCELEKALQRGTIRLAYPSELFPSLHEICVPVGAIHQESGHLNHTDMVYVCAIAKALNARRIFEIGTYRGQTTCALAQVCPEAEVFTLNLPPEADPRYAPFLGWYIRKSPFRDRIHQLFSNSFSFDTTPYRKSMDLVFIDGDHSYDAVKNDTQKALELLRPGGILLWHDFAGKCPGVVRWVEEFSQGHPLFCLRKTCLAVWMDGVDARRAEL